MYFEIHPPDRWDMFMSTFVSIQFSPKVQQEGDGQRVATRLISVTRGIYPSYLPRNGSVQHDYSMSFFSLRFFTASSHSRMNLSWT